MISSKKFIDDLLNLGYGPFICVPCSNFKQITSYLLSNKPEHYIIANNEGEALSIASGMFLAEKKPVVMCQNSGLCNLLDPLTSLNLIYDLHVLLIISWRGKTGTNDEIQHEIMGSITVPILELLKINYLDMSKDNINYKTFLEKNSLKTTSLLVDKDTFLSDEFIINKVVTGKNNLTKNDAIKTIIKHKKSNAKIFSTNGFTSRILYDVCHDKNNFYMLGSMGCVSSIALGYSMNKNDDEQVIVLDGDGGCLMRLESMVSIGKLSPKNFTHIVLDDNKYESTGKQPTNSSNLPLEEVATTLGYDNVYKVTNIKDLKNILISSNKGLSFIRVIIDTASMIAKRPKIVPDQIVKDFKGDRC